MISLLLSMSLAFGYPFGDPNPTKKCDVVEALAYRVMSDHQRGSVTVEHLKQAQDLGLEDQVILDILGLAKGEHRYSSPEYRSKATMEYTQKWKKYCDDGVI